MAYNGNYFIQDDFNGGYCPSLPSTDLVLSQASDMDNLVIGIGGKSIRTLWPTIKLHTTAAGAADSYPVVGVGILNKTTGGNPQLLIIRNAKAYGSQYFFKGVRNGGDAFVDRTGAVTLTANANVFGEYNYNRWNFFQFDDVLIGFGGEYLAQHAPIKWTGGTANIAALGGSPPSAIAGFTANNRAFAYATAADPQRLYWSILGNAEDWTGVGSGYADIGTLDDSTGLTCVVPLSQNTALAFKNYSIHSVNLTSAPFSSYLLFDGIGTINARTAIVADGVCYFMDNGGRMHSTDGDTLKDYPDSALSGTIQVGLFTASYDLIADGYTPYNAVPWVYRQKTDEYDWLVWTFSSPSTGPTSAPSWPLTLIWDLKNRCWLRCSTNFGFVTGAWFFNTIIGGSPNSGYVYQPDVYGQGVNDSNDSTTITSYWKTGWLTQKLLDKVTQIDRVGMNLDLRPVASGTTDGGWQIDYGFSFGQDVKTTTLSALPDSNVGLQPQAIRYVFLKGKGTAQQFKFTWIGTNQNNFGARINSIVYAGKQAGMRLSNI